MAEPEATEEAELSLCAMRGYNAIGKAIEMLGPKFSALHGFYLRHGYCYSEPDMLALARPCDHEDPDRWVEPDKADAWWVELAIGEKALPTLISKIPFNLKYIGWRRGFKGKDKPRFYNLERVVRNINRYA